MPDPISPSEDTVLATAVGLSCDEAVILVAGLANLAHLLEDEDVTALLVSLASRFVPAIEGAGPIVPDIMSTSERARDFILNADTPDLSGVIPFLARREDLGDIIHEVDLVVVGVGR